MTVVYLSSRLHRPSRLLTFLLGQAEIPREHFPRNVLARMSATSRAIDASGRWNLANDTTHEQTGSTAPHQQTRRPTDQVSAWQAGRGSRPTHPTSARGSLRGLTACRACRRGCHKDPREKTAFVEFKLHRVKRLRLRSVITHKIESSAL